MSDAALENAIARKATAIEKLNSIANDINGLIERHGQVRGELDELDSFIKMWHEMAGIQQPASEEQSAVTGTPSGEKRIRPKNPPRGLVASACVKYIREAGRPLSRSELYIRLTEEGIAIRGKDSEMVLSTMLWRSKGVIRRLPEGGYWPADMPTPAERMLSEELGVELDF